jgi:hypothetical protein
MALRPSSRLSVHNRAKCDIGEGLRVSLDMETGFKGIKVGASYYKLSQLADDTTVLMGDKKEIKYVNRAIQRWCGATGMRENIRGCYGDSQVVQFRPLNP